MTRQISHFLNISCFPNFRRDLQGMSGSESHIWGEGQCLPFGVRLPRRAVRGSRAGAGLGGQPRPKALPLGGQGVGAPASANGVLA